VRLGSIRKSEVVDLVGVGANSNCTRCRLEIGALGRSSGWGNAGKHARRGRRKALRTRRVLDLGRHGAGIRRAQAERQVMRRGVFKLWCLVTIRKSDVIDFEWLAVISNRTRCRLEMDSAAERTSLASAAKAAWSGAAIGGAEAPPLRCTRCRFEIVRVAHGQPAQQAILRSGCRLNVEVEVAGRRSPGDVPGVRRPAALGVRPERRM
jgi:hypothetical protein